MLSYSNKDLISKNTTKPWISGEICANIKICKTIIHLLDNKKMSHQFYARFKMFVTNQIRQTKINYFMRKFQQFKSDCKITWKQINSIIWPNRISKKNMNKICENGLTFVIYSYILLQMYSIHTL